MLRRLATLGAAIGALLVASPASAQQAGKAAFGDQGEFIFGADRLFGLFAFTQTQTQQNGPFPTITTTGTSMAFFGGLNSNSLGAGNPTFYNIPRLGFDYTIIPGLTLGGEAIVWFTVGGSQSQNAPANTSVPNPSGNLFGIAPRVGYIFGFSDVFAFWLRGGVSYYTANVSSQNNRFAPCSDTSSANVFGLDVDPVFTISPAQHFAFQVGPTLDWGFAGGYSNNTVNGPGCSQTVVQGNYNALNFAINAGLLGWF